MNLLIFYSITVLKGVVNQELRDSKRRKDRRGFIRTW